MAPNASTRPAVDTPAMGAMFTRSTSQDGQTKPVKTDWFGDLLKMKLVTSFFVVADGGFWLKKL